MKRHVLAICLVASVQAASATVFQHLSDSQLLDHSDAVVIATVQDAVSRDASWGIVTDYHLVVEQALKGNVAGVITLTEFGGRVGTRFALIPDSATYAAGERVLVFLKRRADGTFFTTSMALGKFVFDGAFVRRDSDELKNDPLRDASKFAAFIRGAKVDYIAAVTAPSRRIAANGNAKNYALSFGGLPVRWSGGAPTVTFKVSNAALDTTNAIGQGLAAWTNDPNSNITLVNGGATTKTGPEPTGGSNNPDNENTIFLGYTFSSVAGVCDLSQACTIIWGNNTSGPFNSWDGDTWISILDADIVVQPSVGAAQLPSLITHELGHSIGIRHSDQGTPSSSSAIMTSTVPAAFGATLQQWDKDAVDSLYGAGPVCSAPTSVSVSGGGPVASGSFALLTATPNGSAPVSYQWYDGLTGDVSTPVGTNSNTFTTPSITTTKNYWVRVTSTSTTCPGSADSATVTLTPQACQKPVITVDPAGTTISSGQTTTLTVGASGSQPLTFIWYQGAPPDTSNPVAGASGSQFTSPPLTQTTSYWVRVSNACGSADSKAAVITIPGTCSGPTFSLQPASITIDPGQLAYLQALAPDATSYQWYRGTAPDTSTPAGPVFTGVDAFIQKLFVDVLHQPADPASVATFKAAINGGASRATVAQTLLTSSTYRTVLIVNDYAAYLRRSASPADIAFWLPALSSGLTDEQFSSAILASPEYFALAGGTNAAWLNRLFNDVLGRSPNATESQLAANARSTVAMQILTSTEARTRLVQSWYTAFLHRSPTSNELSAALAQLASSNDELVMSALLGSDEYVNFGSLLPVGPLTSTTTFWVAAMNASCSTNSATATITVRGCAKPAIVTQPSNAAVTIGNAATFSVVSTGATSYQWYRGTAGDTSNAIGGATGAVLVTPPLTSAGATQYWVRVTNSCGSTDSTAATATVSCGAPNAPAVSAPASQTSGNSYAVSWSGSAAVSSKYDVQEATKSDFSDATTFTIADGTTTKTFAHTVTSDTRFFYRVRAYALCDGSVSQFGNGTVLVTAPPAPASSSFSLTGTPCAPQTACSASQTLFVPGFGGSGTNDTFAVTSDKPYVTITPASGPLPPQGTTVTIAINTGAFAAGSVQFTVTVSRTQGVSGKTGTLGTTTTSTVPVSVSLVTPVTPAPKDGNAPPNTVLVPAIAHADGVNSQFQSDVRITNTAPQPITYQLTYTPSATDGTQSGKQTQITIDAGETKALDDVVKNWYGAGSQGEGGIGTLEIRPLNYAGKTGVNVSFATVAASRTYNNTANGTFGQYIPAIPLIDFLAKSDIARISLQQVAQSTAYRTNFGFVEGSGQPIDFVATLLDDKNNVVAQRPYSLKPFEHQQISMTNFFPGISVSDGRLEVKVTSDTGRLTAYASVLDNTTSDPLLVFPVDPSAIGATRFVVPGVAELNNGSANFHTDMRVYNGGASPANITLAFGSSQAQKQLAAGEVWSIDNVLPALFGINGTGGAVVATTTSPAQLVLTARTYSRRDDGGTFGQFIPGVTASDAVGVGDRPLQIVQLEQSPAFRSNIGLVEVTGSPVTLDIAAYAPDSKIAAHVGVTLAPGQFMQLNSVLAAMGFAGNVYNGRIAVTATGGTGKVAAYGSVVDNRTQDPTYVPAQ